MPGCGTAVLMCGPVPPSPAIRMVGRLLKAENQTGQFRRADVFCGSQHLCLSRLCMSHRRFRTDQQGRFRALTQIGLRDVLRQGPDRDSGRVDPDVRKMLTSLLRTADIVRIARCEFKTTIGTSAWFLEQNTAFRSSGVTFATDDSKRGKMGVYGRVRFPNSI